MRDRAEPAVLGAARVRLELQPQRRPREAERRRSSRARRGRSSTSATAAYDSLDHLARVVRGGDALLPRRRHAHAEPARAPRSSAGSTGSGRARCSSASPSSRGASTSICFTRAPRRRTATVRSARPTSPTSSKPETGFGWAGPEPADLGGLVRHERGSRPARCAGRAAATARPGHAARLLRRRARSRSASASRTTSSSGSSTTSAASRRRARSCRRRSSNIEVYLYRDENFARHVRNADELVLAERRWTVRGRRDRVRGDASASASTRCHRQPRRRRRTAGHSGTNRESQSSQL